MNLRSSTPSWIFGLACVAAALSGCTIGPKYVPTQVKTLPSFGELQQTTSTDPVAQPSRTVQSAPPTEWWRVFGDPELNRLIDEAFRHNYCQVRRIEHIMLDIG